MTLLPEVGYLADTPRAINGSDSLSLNSAFSACTSADLPCFFRWNGRSKSSSPPESLGRQLGAEVEEGRMDLHGRVEVHIHGFGSFA